MKADVRGRKPRFRLSGVLETGLGTSSKNWLRSLTRVVYLHIGRLLRLRWTRASIRWLRYAVERDRTDARAGWYLAASLWEVGRYEEAVTTFRELLREHRGVANGWYGLGCLFDQLGRHEEAVACPRRGNSHSTPDGCVSFITRAWLHDSRRTA